MKAPHQSPLVALTCVVSLACATHANAFDGQPTVTPVDAQKGIYLVCQQASTNGARGADSVVNCRIAFEKLEQRKCETGLSQAIVSRSDYSSKNCEQPGGVVPRSKAP